MRAISRFIPDTGIATVSCSAVLALRMRVSMSPMGSVTMTAPHQLDFVIPGITPWWASSRRQMRHTPNLRKYARERPQREQRWYERVWNFAPLDCLTLRAVFAIPVLVLPPAGLARERHSEGAQQLARAVVVVVIVMFRPRTSETSS